MKKIDLLKKELDEASRFTARDERALAITKVLQKAFLPFDEHPILVGGSAVEVYTRGMYASGDLDFVLPTSSEIKKTMKQLGFKREGRLFLHPNFHLVIEFPSSSLEKEESYVEINYQGTLIRIISVEDLIIDRLNAFKWGSVSQEAKNIFLLLNHYSTLDKTIKAKAKKHDVLNALNDFFHLKKEMKKKKLNKKEIPYLLNKIIEKYI